MWELIPETKETSVCNKGNINYTQSSRLNVPGGWLVRTISFGWNHGTGVCQTFVSDPEHEWKLTK